MGTFARYLPLRSIGIRDILLGAVILFLVAQNGLPSIAAFAQDGGSVPRAVPATAAFTYQGRLTQDDIPQSGSYDFEFRVFDTPTVGQGVALGTGAHVISDHAVDNGLFSVPLDFGAGVFTGDKRWIEVRVRPGASTDPNAFVTLGRQELTATPYALYALNIPDHDHVGESWSATTFDPALKIEQSGFGHGLDVRNVGGLGVALNATSSNWIGVTASGRYGVYATSNQAGGQAVYGNGFGFSTGVAGYSLASGFAATYGENPNGTGVSGFGQLGVHGSATSAGGYGVLGDGGEFSTGVVGISAVDGFAGTLGQNLKGTGVSGVGRTGVNGAATSPGGAGVRGDGGNFSTGVIGLSTVSGFAGVYGENLNGAGVTGVSRATIGGSNLAGVVGLNNGTGCSNTASAHTGYCAGVFGFADNAGVASMGVGGQGNRIGVWGYATDPGGYGGYFLGNVFVSGLLDAPSGEVKVPDLKPDLNNNRNLGFASLAWKQVVSHSYPSPSDARLKSSVEALDYGLAAVLLLQPVQYEYNSALGEKRLGLIAQDVQPIIPEVVRVGEDGDATLTLSYQELIPVLISAIQEQQEQIESLEARLAVAEAR